MTAAESKDLKKGARVYWRGKSADSGVITETSWDHARNSANVDRVAICVKAAVISPDRIHLRETLARRKTSCMWIARLIRAFRSTPRPAYARRRISVSMVCRAYRQILRMSSTIFFASVMADSSSVQSMLSLFVCRPRKCEPATSRRP